MSQTLAVAARELRERWLLLPAGLALGFVPLVLPSLGLMPPNGADLVGVFIALLLGLIAALVAGASMLARDTLDGRLGFLFSRPVSWPAIWGGKWVAAIILVAGSAALAALPWMLVHPPPEGHGSWGTALVDPQGFGFFFLLLLLGIGLANFNATAFRSRSSWVAVDLGLLLLATWLVFRWLAPLFSLRVLGPYPLAQVGSVHVLLAPLAVALLVASAAQVVFGRTDLRRAHRAMSLAFWAVVFVALGGAGLRLAWARAATPADLEQYVSGAYDPSGRWLYAEGLSRRGGGAAFLIDTDENRYVPLGLDRLWEGQLLGMTFAADGRSGVLLTDGPDFSGILSIELGGDEPRFTGGELEKSPRPDFGTRLALSPSGTYVLLAHGHGASLFATPSGRRVATATRTVLHVFDPEGVAQSEIVLDRVPAGLAVGPEVAAGRVAIRFGPETVVVDLTDGRVVETVSGRHPLRGFWFLGGPGSPGTTTHFLVDHEGSVVRRDFATGEERVVAGPGATPGERLELR